jgi:hypothetical protein
MRLCPCVRVERIGEDPVLTKAFLEDLAQRGVVVEEKSRMERLS